MNLDGGYLTLLIGPTVPRPAVPELLRSLEEIEVKVNHEESSGFQLRFRAGRSGALAAQDVSLLQSSQLQPFCRVIVVITLRAIPHVLLDGIIADIQYQPGQRPGEGVITVTGEDLTLLMDLEEKQVEHPGLNAPAAVAKVLSKYAGYGIVPEILPKRFTSPPSPTARVPVQCETDLQFLRLMAQREDCVFFVRPGPLPCASTAYWGPAPRLGLPQKALTANMGTATNVESIEFHHDALSAKPQNGVILDPKSGKSRAVKSDGGQLPLAKQSAIDMAQKHGRSVKFRRSGMSASDAEEQMKAAANRSAASAVVGRGQLNAFAYGGVLQAHKLVGVRGVGLTYDGLYLVTEVTHTLRRGSYTQSFTIIREGTGATVPVVRV